MTNITNSNLFGQGNQENFEGTMSSREIAELTGKDHRNVLRDCDHLNQHYEKLSLLKIEQGYYTAENGQKYRCYNLTKIQTIDLMTGYRPDLRIKINRRWEELERKAQQREIANSLTRLDIIQLALEAEKENQHLKQIVEVQEKKLAHKSAKEDFAEHVTANDEYTLTITAIASRLGISGVKLNKILLDKKVIRKLGGDYAITSKYLNKRYGKRIMIKLSDDTYKEALRWSAYGEAFIVNLVKGLDKDRHKVQMIPITNSITVIN